MKIKSTKKILYAIIFVLLVFIIYRELSFNKCASEVENPEDFIGTVSLEWEDANPQKMAEIQKFIEENKGVSLNDIYKDVVHAYIANVEVDLEDKFIGDLHKDMVFEEVNYFDNYIPRKLQLKNNLGDFYDVDVYFGKTNSDNKSAYQKVSNNLIEAIKYALTYANNDLYENEKINSIYIKCTINGKRKGPSNHPFGNAVDISRINGRFMLNTGVTRQIVFLQDGFNDFEYIRENFGPAYKHKYSIEKLLNLRWNREYPISGHRDHIHVSVRK